MINAFDLNNLYQTYFNSTPYFIAPKGSDKPLVKEPPYSGIAENLRSKSSIDYTLSQQLPLNKKGLYGHDIWFPITFWRSNKVAIEIEACTVGVNIMSTIIRTPVSERKGTVKEQFNVDDYKFNIKGFLIGKDRFFPEEQILILKELAENKEPISLHGGYVELFLKESNKVAITSLEFPEVQGKAYWIRPFTLACESDFIQDLKIE